LTGGSTHVRENFVFLSSKKTRFSLKRRSRQGGRKKAEEPKIGEKKPFAKSDTHSGRLRHYSSEKLFLTEGKECGAEEETEKIHRLSTQQNYYEKERKH